MITIAENAFWQCDALSDIYFSGTAAQWADIEILQGNNSLTFATLHPSAYPTPPALSGTLDANHILHYTALSAPESAKLMCAIYRENGRLVKMEYLHASSGEVRIDEGTYCRLFVVDGGTFAPLCEALDIRSLAA